MGLIGLLSFVAETANELVTNRLKRSGLPTRAHTSSESAPKVVASIMKEFCQLKQDPVGEEELRRAKDHLKGSLMLGLESTSSRMGNLARQELYFKRFFSLNEMLELIESVTAEQVLALAQQFFDPKQIAIAMLGRLEGFKVRRQDLIRSI